MVSCKDKLAHFRIKELKDVLTQLGLSKQGKKQDLVDRILAVLSNEQGMSAKKNSVGKEEVAKLVDGIYRKMLVNGATDLASKSQMVLDSSNVNLKEEIEDTYQMKIECPCGSSLQAELMIQCEDIRCRIWQHASCVIIPEEPMERGSPQVFPETFLCGLCRLNRADPFWETVATPLYPTKWAISSVPVDSTNQMGMIEKSFHLNRADMDLLAKQEYDVQAWCMLLNDKVEFRMQWPQYADLQVNGVPVRCINRPGSQLLGANGRDDGPIITHCSRGGTNKILLTGCDDARIFCFGVRLVKRRTLVQVLNIIPKELDGEVFDDALARVRRCVGGETVTENADSDSDLEVVADFVPVNLRCPMSGSRMKVAGRFKPCVHMGCFDLHVFVKMNQRSRKWQCPICLKNYSLEHIIIDPYFNRITSQLQTCGEEVSVIEVKPNGSWRAKAEGNQRNIGDLGWWHFPDGTLIESQDIESNPKPGILKHVIQEGGSENCELKVGLKKNRNGLWKINKPEDVQTFPYGDAVRENLGNHTQDIIPMSSSATGSGKEGEDPSVYQDGDVNFGFPTNGFELETISPNFVPAYGFNDRNPPAPARDAEVIVLSDSDEENEPFIYSASIYNNNRTDAPIVSSAGRPKGISDSCHDSQALVNDRNSSLGLFNANNDEFGMNLWHLPTFNQNAPGFQLFGSNIHQGSINCASSTNGYSLAADTGIGSCTLLPESSVDRTNAEMNDGLVNNTVLCNGIEGSLHIFLPLPSDASVEADVAHQPGVSTGVQTEDWVSLRLGAGGDSAVANGLSSGKLPQSKDSSLDALADTASLLIGVNDGVSMKNGRKRSDGPFNFPRQRRSVRRRYPNVDSDTEEGANSTLEE